jgi:serine/threonine-protein kinase TNNI3K
MRPSVEGNGGGQADATGSSTKSTTAGSGSATTGNDSTQKKNSGSQSGSFGGGGGGGNGTSGSSASSVYMVAGGSGSGVVLCIFGFLYFRKRADRAADAKNLDAAPDLGGYLPTLQSSRSRASSSESVHVMGNTGFDNVVIQSKASYWEDEAIAAARIPFEKLKRGTLLSRGGFGEVYRGTYRGENVAIKTLLRERRKDLRQIEKFLAEVKLMATLEHDHIVQFVGVAWDSLTELCVVSEFMGGGDLRTLLQKYNEDSATYPKGFNADKIKIALHVSHALTYMHSLQPAVLHRDLKSRNILLDTDLNAKLTDFGVSRERADSTMTVGVGSSLWIAPEIMTGGYYDEKADVFSFGVVLSELDTHCLPYSHAVESGSGGRKLPDAVIVQMMTINRITVEFTDEEESPMAQLGRRCVAVDPADRPTSAEVQHQIHQLSRGSF